MGGIKVPVEVGGELARVAEHVGQDIDVRDRDAFVGSLRGPFASFDGMRSACGF